MTEQGKHPRHDTVMEIHNIGLIDRLLRAAVAVILIGQILFVRESPPLQNILLLLGMYPAFTAVWGWDPLYHLADMRSCGRSPANVCGTLPAQLRAALQSWHKPLTPARPLSEGRSVSSSLSARREASNEAASWGGDKAA